jgi:Holliday junction resolvase RusA-like endonuclease
MNNQRLEVTLPGKPYSQPRIRVSKWGAYHPKEHVQKLKTTSKFLNESAEIQKWKKTAGPVKVTIVTVSRCIIKHKKQVILSGKRLYKPTRPDIDNYAKYILDCCSKAGNIWGDDSQVVQLVQKKFYGQPKEEPYTNVIIEILDTHGDL